MPKVSVILPLYNGARFLREAIESILNQTYKDYEFIIINDASTDNSCDVIAEYPDRRIRLIHNESNMGQSASLNKGISSASGEYISRMDQDDVSLPLRLEKQVRFMDEHPVVGVCGTFVSFINQKHRSVVHSYLRNPLVNSQELKAQLLFGPCFVHPTVMVRASTLLNHGIKYEEDYEPAEDYWMWNQLAPVTEFSNLPDVLLKLREHSGQRSRVHLKNQVTAAERVRKHALQAFFDGRITESSLSDHMKIARFEHLKGLQGLSDAEEWLCCLLQANQARRRYDLGALETVVSTVWYYLCMNSTHIGLELWKRYSASSLCDNRGKVVQYAKFFTQCVIRHKVKLPHHTL